MPQRLPTSSRRRPPPERTSNRGFTPPSPGSTSPPNNGSPLRPASCHGHRAHLDAATGGPRYLPPAEPAEWARAIFSTAGAAHGYFLGAVDPNTGTHRRGQLAYRLYLDTDRQAIPVPHQLVTCPHYLLPGLDGKAEITIPTTA